MRTKVIVAHPHKQHSFQLAVALEQGGMLEKYATTVYLKPVSITSLLSRLLPSHERKKAKTRRTDLLPDNKVLQFSEIRGLIFLLALRLAKNKKRIMEPIDAWVNKSFGRRVARFAAKSGADAVVGYDTQSETLFSELENMACEAVRVLDVSAANLLYLKKVYEKDMLVSPQFKSLLLNERPFLLSQDEESDYFISLNAEINKSDYFVVPSEFVRSSLLFSGVLDSKIFIQPYGIDLNLYQKKTSYSVNLPIRFIYVGGIKQLKGIGYLLEAFSKIDKADATLTVVGPGTVKGTCLERYKDVADFKGTVLHSDIPGLLHEHDVFVFPSLGDSFGFSPLEAAASGLPLILSRNTGLSDYISEGIEGFIIDVHSSNAIEDRVRWFIGNQNAIPTMGTAARQMAARMTLENYYQGIRGIMESI